MSDVGSPPARYQAFDYVQSAKPADAEQFETWLDSDGGDAFVFVDNAGTTEQLDIADHAELSGIEKWQHLSPSDVQAAVDGANIDIQGDADTLDGQHAEDIPTWTVDGTLDTTANPATHTLSGEYDRVKVIIDEWVNSDEYASDLDIQFNGVTDPSNMSYSWFATGDGDNTLTSKINLVYANPGQHLSGEIRVDGRWPSSSKGATVACNLGYSDYNQTHLTEFGFFEGGSPLTSITFQGGADGRVRAHILGMNI